MRGADAAVANVGAGAAIAVADVATGLEAIFYVIIV
jgi:hypothetical protein